MSHANSAPKDQRSGMLQAWQQRQLQLPKQKIQFGHSSSCKLERLLNEEFVAKLRKLGNRNLACINGLVTALYHRVS